LFEKLRPGLLREREPFPYYFESSARLLCNFTKFTSLHETLRYSSPMLMGYLTNMLIYLNALPNPNDQLTVNFTRLMENCLKHNIIEKVTL
jgi:hypothetical protein